MARVVHYDPVTLAVTKYQATANTALYVGVNDVLINPDVSPVVAVPRRRWKVELPTEPYPAGRLVAMAEAQALAPERLDLQRAIDSKTRDLLAPGHLVGGECLSCGSQQTWDLLEVRKNQLTYPYRWPSKDDLSYLTHANAAAVQATIDALRARVEEVVDEGRDLKAQVVDAATLATLDGLRATNAGRT